MLQSFDEIIGHKSVKAFLINKLERNAVPPVILFNGSAGIGKTSIAKLLSLYINGNTDKQRAAILVGNSSIDCIRIYNMSRVGEQYEELVEDLNSTNLSSTGRKCVIIDEVHCMMQKAQDAILNSLEHLPENLYVFLCTTEVTRLSKPLLSRCLLLNLRNLNEFETKQLILTKLNNKNIKFSFDRNKAIALIAMWANNQPRLINNLIDTFPENSTITKDDLSLFVNPEEVLTAVQIIKYLYSSMTLGIDFINSVTITNELLSMLLELLKVLLGGTSVFFDEVAMSTLRAITVDDNFNLDYALHFIVAVTKEERISKRVFIAKFIENHSSEFLARNDIPSTDVLFETNDIKTINDNAIEKLKDQAKGTLQFDTESVNLESLFSTAVGGSL